VTDPGKKSKQGRLALVKHDGEYRTVRAPPGGAAQPDDELVVVFENGVLTKDWSLKEVRERASQGSSKS
jgi:nicotinamide phosphoribosyltransferase